MSDKIKDTEEFVSGDKSASSSDEEEEPYIEIEEDPEDGDSENETESEADEDEEAEKFNLVETETEMADDDCLYQFAETAEEVILGDLPKTVPPEERITPPVMTKYEMVRIIGVRAKQLSLGAKVLLKNPGDLSSLDLAKLELKHNMCPFIIKRPLPNGQIEYWKISELEKPDLELRSSR